MSVEASRQEESTGFGGALLVSMGLRALAGGAAGLLSVLLIPVWQAGTRWMLPQFGGAAANGLVFGALATSMLAAADESSHGSAVRLGLRCGVAAVVGAMLGTGYSLLAQMLLVAGYGAGADTELLNGVSWALMGLGIGLGSGVATQGGRRAYHACAAGALGGALAWVLARLTGSPGQLTSNASPVGLILIGICVGAATALVEHTSAAAWVRYLTGSREGKQLSLPGEVAVLGRDELVDIPLFGDDRLDPRHAEIHLHDPPWIRENGREELLLVDGVPVREALLSDGSLIQLGKHRLRFSCVQSRLGNRATTPPPTAILLRRLAGEGAPGSPAPADGPPPLAVPPPSPDADRTLLSLAAPGVSPTDPGAPTQVSTPPGARSPDYLVLCLVDPRAGPVRVPLLTGRISIGRGSDNVLPVRDSRVSRHHAAIEAVQAGGDLVWVATDLDSTNGTWLNGVRIRRAGLAAGDVLSVGDAVLRVEPPPPLSLTPPEGTLVSPPPGPA